MAERDLRASVISRGHTPPVLESSEHDLDAIAPLVSPLVVFDRRLALRHCQVVMPGRDQYSRLVQTAISAA